MSNATLSEDVAPAESIALAVICIIGFLLNSTALFVMLTNFTKIFSNAEACFIANLAFADLLTSLGGFIWGIAPVVVYSRPVLKAFFCINWTTVAASFLTLFCMSSERLFVVLNPPRAHRVFNKRFAYACCALVWFISILAGCMIIVNQAVALCVMTIMFEVSLLATLACYLGIYLKVKKLGRDSHRRAARYTAKTAKLNIEVEENEPALHHRVTVRQESRVTNLVFVLVVVLIITVLPYMILLQVNIAYLLSCPKCSIVSTLTDIQNYMLPLEMLNFVLNPIVYTWRLPKFRQALKKTFRRLVCCKTLRRKANLDAHVHGDLSYSSDSDSLANGPATIFTGRDTAGAPLNNNTHT